MTSLEEAVIKAVALTGRRRLEHQAKTPGHALSFAALVNKNFLVLVRDRRVRSAFRSLSCLTSPFDHSMHKAVS